MEITEDYHLGCSNIYNMKTAKSEKFTEKYNEIAEERIKNLNSKTEVY